MTTDPKQLTIRVWLDEHEPYPFDVITRWTDNRNWETTAYKHKWPPFQEAPFTWLGFLAWSAARRTGAITPDTTWEKFSDRLQHVENLDGEETAVTPTEPGAGPGLSVN